MSDKEGAAVVSTAIEKAEPRQSSVALVTEREMKSLEFYTRAICRMDPRLKKIDDAEERFDIGLSLALTIHSYGLVPSPPNAKKFHLIGDEWVESSQLLIGLLQRNGIHVKVVEDSEQRAVVRGRRPDDPEWEVVRYPIAKARSSGHLDEWVEKWQQSQSGKKYPIKFTIRRDGQVMNEPWPQWVQKEVEGGYIKRFDAWWDYRSDMLVNRALRRLAKRVGGDALLGVLSAADEVDDDVAVPTSPDLNARMDANTKDRHDDDDIVDAELVGEGEGEVPAAPEPSPAPTCSQGVPGCTIDGEHKHDSFIAAKVSDRWCQDFAIACTEAGLNRDGKLALVVHAIGRPVESSKEIMRSEARKVRDWLQEIIEGRYEVIQTGPDSPLQVVEAKKPESDAAPQYAPGEEPFTD